MEASVLSANPDDRGAAKVSASHDDFHGQPPLTDPSIQYWMKWEEWNPGMLEENQVDLMRRINLLVRPALEWFYGLDTSKRGSVGT